MKKLLMILSLVGSCGFVFAYESRYSMQPPKCTAFEPAWSGWMAGASRKCAKFAKGRPAFDSMMGEYNLPTSKREDGALYF